MRLWAWRLYRGWCSGYRACAGRRGCHGTHTPCPLVPAAAGFGACPRPGRGTRPRSRTVSNWGESLRCPAVTTIDMGFCPCSTAIRLDEDATGWLLLQLTPFAGSGRVSMGPTHRGVDVEIPRDRALRVGPGLELGEDPVPRAVPLPLPPAEQVVNPTPGPVLGWHVPPRDAGPGPQPCAVDQLPPRPHSRPARHPASRQQRLQHCPLFVWGISPRREPRSSKAQDPPFDTGLRRPTGKVQQPSYCTDFSRSVNDLVVPPGCGLPSL